MNIQERYPDLTAIQYIKSLDFRTFKRMLEKGYNETGKSEPEDEKKEVIYDRIQLFCEDLIRTKGEIKRLYTHSKTNTSYVGGRLFCGSAVQNITYLFRGLISKHTTDIDMKNAHPCILQYICGKHNIPCLNLTNYINNRDTILNNFNNREEGKKAFLSSVNNDKPNKKIKDDTFVLFDMEMKIIQNKVISLPEYEVIKNTVPLEKNYNRNGSSINRILCHYENMILQEVIDFAVGRGLEIFALMFDGIMVYGDYYSNQKIINDLERFVEEKFPNLNMKFAYKEHDNSLQVPEDFTEKLTAQTELKQLNDLEQLNTDIGTLNYIKQLVPDKFIWVEKKLYCWVDNKWDQSSNGFVDYFKMTLLPYIQKIYAMAKKAGNVVKILECKSIIQKWGNKTSINNIIALSEAFFTRKDISFDSNDDLLGFNNGVFELNTSQFRAYKPTDYMTMTTGYDYSPCRDEAKIDTLYKLFATIFPNSLKMDLYLTVLSAGLTGKCIENFIIANGCGRNGKGLINEFAKLVFGDYAYIYAPVCLLTEKDKTGANPEKYKLKNKRITMMKEPVGVVEKLRNDRIKDFTGGGNVSGRDLYGNAEECEIRLKHILIMECNKRPEFAEDPSIADLERVIDIDFENRFTTKPTEVNGVDVFLADIKYKSTEWKQDHIMSFCHILLDYFEMFKTNNYQFDIPKCITDRTVEYMNESYPILKMMTDIVRTGVETDTLTATEIYTSIKNSEYYQLISKMEKRRFTKPATIEFLKKHNLYSTSFYDRRTINKKEYNSTLFGFKLRVEKESNIDTETI
jgi:phage/plasmid-associated DNA primase